MSNLERLIEITTLHDRAEIVRAQMEMNEMSQGRNTKYVMGSKTTDLHRTIIEDITDTKYTNDEWDYIRDLEKNELSYKSGKKLMKKSIIALHIYAYYPGETQLTEKNGHVPEDQKVFEGWQRDTLAYMEDYFMKANVKMEVLHMDGQAPHFHFIIVPMTKNKNGDWRLCYKDFINGPHVLRQFQMRYESAIGYTRKGKKFVAPIMSANEIGVQARTTKLRADETCPGPAPGMDAETYYEQVVIPVFQEMYSRENEILLHSEQSGHVLEEYEKMKVALEQANKRIVQMEHQMKSMRLANSESTLLLMYEETGMSIHPDQEMIQNVYKPLKQLLIEAGKEEFEANSEEE